VVAILARSPQFVSCFFPQFSPAQGTSTDIEPVEWE
jgi:hypothetical protein